MTSNSQSEATTRLVSIELDSSKVKLAWSDSRRQEIHSICLRHSPGFPGGERPAGIEGRFPSGSQALVPEHAELTADGDLQLYWQPGGLRSQHSCEWLRAQSDLMQARGQQPPGQVVWDATRIEDLPKPSYTAVMTDEEARLELFDQVLNWGVTLIREVPAHPGTVETVAGWFGQIQPNPYADDSARPLVAQYSRRPGAAGGDAYESFPWPAHRYLLAPESDRAVVDALPASPSRGWSVDAGRRLCGRRPFARAITRGFCAVVDGADCLWLGGR